MRFGGILLGAALILGACTSDPEPKEPDPTPTATESSSPGPTAPEPTVPPQADDDTAAGAAAFVTYWVDVLNYGATTGDTTTLRKISSADCSGCQKYIALYRKTYEGGGFFKGGLWSLSRYRVTSRGGDYFLTATVTYSAGTFRVDRSTPIKSSSSSQEQISFAVGREGNSRVLTQVGLGGVR